MICIIRVACIPQRQCQHMTVGVLLFNRQPDATPEVTTKQARTTTINNTYITVDVISFSVNITQ